MEKITISLTNSELIRAGSERAARLLIWQTGHDAGIPWWADLMTGDVKVDSGILTIWEDWENDRLMVEWDPREPVQPADAPRRSMWSRLMEWCRR